MSDRELIETAIRKALKPDSYNWNTEEWYCRHINLTALADAVLDALGDRLLPELPDNTNELHIHFHYCRNGDHEVWVFGDYRKGFGYQVEECGEGPSLTAAIRNALKEATDADR